MAEQKRDENGRFAGGGAHPVSEFGAKSGASAKADAATEAVSDHSYEMSVSGRDTALDHSGGVIRWEAARDAHKAAAEHHELEGNSSKAAEHRDGVLNAEQRIAYHAKKRDQKIGKLKGWADKKLR
jgi:hypothetical protein